VLIENMPHYTTMDGVQVVGGSNPLAPTSNSAGRYGRALASVVMGARVSPPIQIPEQTMTAPVASALDALRSFNPKLAELTDDVLFGDDWERKGLSKRDRSLVTVAALVALYRPEQLRGHLKRALDNGVGREELVELITHLAFYSGWPTAMSASKITKEVFDGK
jgi:4-carboxymuconolactone decarboxylase